MAVAAVVGGKEGEILRRPWCEPVRALDTRRGRILLFAELSKKNPSWKRMRQPVVCDRPDCELIPQNPPAEGLSDNANDLNTITQSCKGHAELLVSIKAVEKVKVVRNLNLKEHSKITHMR